MGFQTFNGVYKEENTLDLTCGFGVNSSSLYYVVCYFNWTRIELFFAADLVPSFGYNELTLTCSVNTSRERRFGSLKLGFLYLHG